MNLSKEDFANAYRLMTDDQLARVAAEGGLLPDAQVVLLQEIQRRGITDHDIAWAKEAIDTYLQKARSNQPLFGTYFVLPWGIGSSFRGRTYLSDVDRKSGVELRTKWIIFLWIPIIPLSSSRIRYQSHTSNFLGSSSTYIQLSREPLNWKQIRPTWGITAVVLFTLFVLLHFLL